MTDILNALNTRQSADRQLRWSLALSDRIASVFSFSAIVAYTLGIHTHFFPGGRSVTELDAVRAFLLEKGWPLALAAVTLIWVMRYKSAVRNELEILLGCFSRLNPLPEWEALLGSRYVPLLSIGLTATFLLLGALVDRIELYALVVLIINILDVRGNSVIRRNLTRFFMDGRFMPLPDDPSREFVLRRRAVAEAYWIARPQIERIGLVMIAMVVAILLSVSDAISNLLPWLGPELRKQLAYCVVIVTVLVNTATMALWRRSRDVDLRDIDADEARALEERVRT